MSVIELRDITMAYENQAVLDHFHLAVEQGEFLTIIGSSGCGKTTVLKLINGLLTPQQGMVLVNGTSLAETDVTMLRRSIGYVIQEIGLFPHMDIEKNISYVPNLSKKKDKAAIAARVRELIQVVGLEPAMLKRHPSELSGGQRQRVGIARALMCSPQIILMDEPFGAVDEITRKRLQEEIRKIHQSLSCTIVFITHDIREALKLGTRVLVMDQGKVVQDGRPEDLRDRPQTDFVRQLVSG